jgi:hypothetical protein
MFCQLNRISSFELSQIFFLKCENLQGKENKGFQ